MKKIFLLFLVLLPTLVAAQSSVASRENQYMRIATQDTIDHHVLIDVLYEDLQVDTVLKQDLSGIQVLQIGEKATIYKSYFRLQMDSVIWSKNNKLSYAMMDTIRKKRIRGHSFACSHVQGTPLFLEQMSITLTRYQALDTAVVWNWTLHHDTMRVCGHLCHKATATFRGRTWTAWWTEDLPYSAGPWKLCGLPGVILRASDSKGMHLIEATAIRKPSLPFIVRLNSGFIPLSLKAYHEKEKDFNLNPGPYYAGMGISLTSGRPMPSRLFYAPYEDVE